MIGTHERAICDFARPKQASNLCALFGLPSNAEAKKLAEAALDPNKELKVYYFEKETGVVRDISDLDPASEQDFEAGWGGLTEFSGHVGNLVARAVANGKALS
jgi:hypothetical protein